MNNLPGLGEYNPGRMTAFERNVVMREAGHGHLACLFSSPDIVYGTNMALITVFIGEGYGHIATRNSLYQLIGRAGRTGKSHKVGLMYVVRCNDMIWGVWLIVDLFTGKGLVSR